MTAAQRHNARMDRIWEKAVVAADALATKQGWSQNQTTKQWIKDIRDCRVFAPDARTAMRYDAEAK